MAYCTNCGTDLASGVRYCASCGTAANPEMPSSHADQAMHEWVAKDPFVEMANGGESLIVHFMVSRLKERGGLRVSGWIRKRRTVDERIFVDVLGDVVRTVLAMGAAYPDQSRELIKRDYLGPDATEAKVDVWVDNGARYAEELLANNLDIEPDWKRFAAHLGTRDGVTGVHYWNPPQNLVETKSAEFYSWIDRLEQIGPAALAWGIRHGDVTQDLFGTAPGPSSALLDIVESFTMHVSLAGELLRRYSPYRPPDDTDPEIRFSVAGALYNRGSAHSDQGDHAAAIADYTLLAESYSADADPAMRALVAAVLLVRGATHGEQGDNAAAIADYTLVVESYSADADPAMREQVAKALYNRGYAHSLQGDHAAAIADFTSVVESYSADANPAIRALVAQSLYNRGYTHGEQGDNAAAIADYTLVVESYSADADPAMREQVAKALYNRGIAHYDQGDHAAAIADFTLLVESYSADANPAIREVVEFARDVIR